MAFEDDEHRQGVADLARDWFFRPKFDDFGRKPEGGFAEDHEYFGELANI